MKSKPSEIPYNENNKNQNKNITNKSNKTKSPFQIFALLKQQKMKEKEVSYDINPMDELILKLTRDLKLLKTRDIIDEKIIEKLFLEKEKQCIIKGQKILLVEVVFHSLKKNKKNENDLLILKLFFMRMEKFISLLLPLKVNISDLLVKLMHNMKCEKKLKDNILFRMGDIGQKLYILLKGVVSIVIKKEKIIQCTPFEYIKFLIILHLYQENNYLMEIILKNKNNINIEEEAISNFFLVFKIFYFLKQNNRLTENYKSIFDFVQEDLKFKKFFENKFNFSPIMALEILNFSRQAVEQLYEFYSRRIKYMNENLKLGLRGSEIFANFIKRQINNSGIIKPESQQELLVYLKPYDEGKKSFKNEEDYYQKILSVNEISSNKIMKTTVDNYIKHLDSDSILDDIRIDHENIKYKIPKKDIIIQESRAIKTYEFFEINELNDGSIFGELALTNPNSKRTATIITKADCYFGTIVKQYYDLSFRAAQEKSQSRNISFFTRTLIFQGISASIFLNKFYYSFKKRTYKKGDILFKKGEERKVVIFIIKGELEISTTMTLKEMNDLIILFGGILNEKYLTDLLNSYEELNIYYTKKKFKIKLCVLKDKEIAGFDDMSINNINMFDCICSSADKTELYELDYSHIREAKKFEKIVNNINTFVNLKRKVFIKRLLEQRNTIIINEVEKIRKIRKNLKEPKKSISLSARNNKYFLSTSKNDIISNNQMILSYRQKQKEEYYNLFSRKNTKSLTKKLLSNSSFKSNIETKTGSKKKEEDIDQILTSFKYGNIDNKVIIDSRIRNKIFKKKNKENIKDNKEDRKNNDKIGFEHNLLKIKKSFFSRNPILLDNINTKDTKVKLFSKTSKPYIDNIYVSRTQKNIIPISKKNKNKKFKGVLSPLKMKECHKNFTEKRNKIYIKNFYYEHQKIFRSLLDIDNETVKEYLKTSNSTQKKIKVSNTQTDLSAQMKEQDDKISKNNFNQESNKTSRKQKINVSIYNSNKIEEKMKRNQKENFVDFLCLDNWEEKENFTKRFLSENIL